MHRCCPCDPPPLAGTSTTSRPTPTATGASSTVRALTGSAAGVCACRQRRRPAAALPPVAGPPPAPHQLPPPSCRPWRLPCSPAAFAQDILFDGWDFQGSLQHDVGTGFAGQFGVFMNGRSSDGCLDLHRCGAGRSAGVHSTDLWGLAGPPRVWRAESALGAGPAGRGRAGGTYVCGQAPNYPSALGVQGPSGTDAVHQHRVSGSGSKERCSCFSGSSSRAACRAPAQPCRCAPLLPAPDAPAPPPPPAPAAWAGAPRRSPLAAPRAPAPTRWPSPRGGASERECPGRARGCRRRARQGARGAGVDVHRCRFCWRSVPHPAFPSGTHMPPPVAPTGSSVARPCPRV